MSLAAGRAPETSGREHDRLLNYIATKFLQSEEAAQEEQLAA